MTFSNHGLSRQDSLRFRRNNSLCLVFKYRSSAMLIDWFRRFASLQAKRDYIQALGYVNRFLRFSFISFPRPIEISSDGSIGV